MKHFLVIVIFSIFSVLINAQADTDNSVTKTSWFWPLLGICLALLLSVPCTLLIVLFICHMKNKSNDDSDESSNNSHTSESSIPVQRERQHRRTRPQRSHYAGGIRSPPPPYTTTQQPQNIFLTPSLPPSYESHINENISTDSSNVFNVQPIENPTPTTTVPINPSTTMPLDQSSILTSPSIQTFQA